MFNFMFWIYNLQKLNKYYLFCEVLWNLLGYLINISGYLLCCGYLWGCNFAGIIVRINVYDFKC